MMGCDASPPFCPRLTLSRRGRGDIAAAWLSPVEGEGLAAGWRPGHPMRISLRSFELREGEGVEGGDFAAPPSLLSPFTLTLALSHQGRGDALPRAAPEHPPLASLGLLAPLSFHERGVK